MRNDHRQPVNSCLYISSPSCSYLSFILLSHGIVDSAMAELEYYSALENVHGHDASALSHAFPFNRPELGPERQLEPQQVAGPSTELTGRELYSKEQWDAQKPVIWRLYNVENKPYRQVVEILRTEQNFYPTYVYLY
jgi:hypothetical protein